MDTLYLWGNLIGYQFAKTKLGKRTIKRRVYPIGFVEKRQYGIARWKGLDWLCVALNNEEWLAIDTMQSRECTTKLGTRGLQKMHEIHKEFHNETGQYICTWLYDGTRIHRTFVEKTVDSVVFARKR